jgi:hypothetical protein
VNKISLGEGGSDLSFNSNEKSQDILPTGINDFEVVVEKKEVSSKKGELLRTRPIAVIHIFTKEKKRYIGKIIKSKAPMQENYMQNQEKEKK